MEKDSVKTDSISSRPLPKWLTDQRDGRNSYQPEKVVMKKDNLLNVAFVSTGMVVLLTVIILTIYILHRNKKRK